ncbi:HDOD domain-containing protein [Chitinibacter sp. SCUT-21]|uniref:EAL and HDOD domain-containing protein n=1 Tax=Chitinibacter sp. SCUT-21 TaxID=2970891 RepID=UPI0035A5AB97
MHLIQLSPLWRQQQWQGLLAIGAESQLQCLQDLLSEQPISATMPCFIPAQNSQWPALSVLPAAQLALDINQSEQLAALAPEVYACGAWYLNGSSAQTAPAKPELLELISLVAADAETATLERVFSRAPDLTFRLLRLVNSVGMRSRIEISSIRHAITVLGRTQLQRWVQLLMYAEQFGESSAMSPLLLAALIRARRLESWAQHGWLNTTPDSAFLLGMLSLLDRLFHKPMPELISNLPLNEKMMAALLKSEGVLGAALEQTKLMEAYWDDDSWAIRPFSAEAIWVKSEVEVYRWVASLAESFQS